MHVQTVLPCVLCGERGIASVKFVARVAVASHIITTQPTSASIIAWGSPILVKLTSRSVLGTKVPMHIDRAQWRLVIALGNGGVGAHWVHKTHMAYGDIATSLLARLSDRV